MPTVFLDLVIIEMGHIQVQIYKYVYIIVYLYFFFLIDEIEMHEETNVAVRRKRKLLKDNNITENNMIEIKIENSKTVGKKCKTQQRRRRKKTHTR